MRALIAFTGLMLVAAWVHPVAAQTPPLPLSSFALQGPGSSIGVQVKDLDAKDASGAGVRIETVQPGTPAARAGFAAGDIVVEFDGQPVRSMRQFRRIVEETRPGQEVKAIVVRAGSRQTLAVTPELTSVMRTPENTRLKKELGQLTPFAFENRVPARPALPARSALLPGSPRLGAEVMALDTQLAGYFGTMGGVLITSVTPDSVAARAGLKAGDVITEIGTRKVNTPADVAEALRSVEAGSSVAVRAVRDKKDVSLTISMAPATPKAPAARQRL